MIYVYVGSWMFKSLFMTTMLLVAHCLQRHVSESVEDGEVEQCLVQEEVWHWLRMGGWECGTSPLSCSKQTSIWPLILTDTHWYSLILSDTSHSQTCYNLPIITTTLINREKLILTSLIIFQHMTWKIGLWIIQWK